MPVISSSLLQVISNDPAANKPFATNLCIFAIFCSILQHFAALGIQDYADMFRNTPVLNLPSIGDFIELTAENLPYANTFSIFAVFCSILQHFAVFQMKNYADASQQYFRHFI